MSLLLPGPSSGAAFCVATYNLENYLDATTETRDAKPASARLKIHESILALKPDVIAFQEIGTVSAVKELQQSLKVGGLDLPHMEHVVGQDTNIFVAVLSRFPFKARHPHTNENFLLGGKRFKTGRGFAEVEIQVSDSYSFTLMAAHLKSKRVVPEADESDLRLEEAKLLRQKVDDVLTADPDANLVVVGDFNDTRDSRSTRALIGRGKTKLVDTRPAERNGDNTPNSNPAWDPRNVTWTHFYGKEDSYSRIDYILLSPGMAREWTQEGTYVLCIPNWGVGSDHRPIVASFEAADK